MRTKLLVLRMKMIIKLFKWVIPKLDMEQRVPHLDRMGNIAKKFVESGDSELFRMGLDIYTFVIKERLTMINYYNRMRMENAL